MSKNNKKDILNQRFSRLLVIEDTGEKYANGSIKWKCLCDCGNIVFTNSSSLKRKNKPTRSCGCYSTDVFKKHNLKGTLEYATWERIRSRCYNKNNPSYKDYGARGIKVCSRWDDPVKFVEDMGKKPKNSSIERLDNNKDYSPDNCIWANSTVQNRNKRNTVLDEELVSLIRGLKEKGVRTCTIEKALPHINKSTIGNVINYKNWKEVKRDPNATMEKLNARVSRTN